MDVYRSKVKLEVHFLYTHVMFGKLGLMKVEIPETVYTRHVFVNFLRKEKANKTPTSTICKGQKRVWVPSLAPSCRMKI